MQTQRTAPRRAHGTGSIVERNGAYFGKWRRDGRQIMRKLGPSRSSACPHGLTRTQAEAKLRTAMESVAVRDVVSRSPEAALTVAKLGDLYLDAGLRAGRKQSTLTDYSMAVRIHLGPFFGPAPVESITADDVEELIELLISKGLAIKSVRNYVGTLSAMLNHAVRKKLIRASPMSAVDLPAAQDALDEELHFLEPREVARLAASSAQGDYETLDRALYLTAALTGLRQGELRGLLWRHVDFGASRVRAMENIVRGHRTTTKSRHGRSVPLAPPVATALLELRNITAWTGPDEPVFATPSTGDPIARHGLMTRYRVALATAGLPAEFRFHDLRHTFGTTLARAGEPVTTIQAWMGHGSLKTTMRYMHYAPAADDAARIALAFDLGPSTNASTNVTARGATEDTSRRLEAL